MQCAEVIFVMFILAQSAVPSSTVKKRRKYTHCFYTLVDFQNLYRKEQSKFLNG